MNSDLTIDALTKLEYALIHGGYFPTEQEIQLEMNKDRAENPNSSIHRTKQEIIDVLRKNYYLNFLNSEDAEV